MSQNVLDMIDGVIDEYLSVDGKYTPPEVEHGADTGNP